jgi:hypothetical protein
MANKEVNELTEIDEIKNTDLVPVYDVDEAGVEKLKKAKAEHLNFRVADTYGDGSLTIKCTDTYLASYTPSASGPAYGVVGKLRISCADMIQSISGDLAGKTLTYFIRQNCGFGPGQAGWNVTSAIASAGSAPWVSNTDPTQAYVEWASDDTDFFPYGDGYDGSSEGCTTVEIFVRDNLGNTSPSYRIDVGNTWGVPSSSSASSSSSSTSSA